MTAKAAQRSRARRRAATPRVVGHAPPLVRIQQYVLLGGVAGSAVLMLTSTNDVFAIPKVTLLVWTAITLIGLSLIRIAATGRAEAPRGPAIPLVLCFVLALVASTLVSDRRMLSLVGEYGRYAGLVAYTTYAVLFIFLLRLYDEAWLRRYAYAVAAATALVTLYGLVQMAGADPYEWGTGGFRRIFGTFGNPNFAAGYLAIVLPLILWVVISPTIPVVGRYVAAPLLLASVAFMLATRSFQGPVASIAGGGLLLAVGLGQAWHRREGAGRVRRQVLALTVTVGAALIAASPWIIRVASRELRAGEERLLFWQAALEMFTDKPILGQGLAMFSTQFPAYRPEEHAIKWQLGTTDTVHNVPLSMFASGGLVLGVAYLAFVGYIAWCLYRGLRRHRGERQLLIGAFGGSWLAYQVQSMVSIDVPSLAVMHFITAGAVIVLARSPELRSFTFFAKPAAQRRGHRRNGRAASVFVRNPAVSVAVSIALLGGLWITSRPLRADLAAGEGRELRGLNQPEAAAREFHRATDLAPWEETYYTMLAGSLVAAGREEEALVAGRRAAQLSTGKVVVTLAAAQLAERLGHLDEAEDWFATAIDLDPYNPQVLLATGQFYAAQDRFREAIPFLERVVEVRPDESRAWATLAALYQEVGREDDARRARVHLDNAG